MSHLKLVETPTLTPEDHRQRFRDAHAHADKMRLYRVSEAEREYANTLLAAEVERKAAIENAPKMRATLPNRDPFEVPDAKALEAAEAAYRKSVEAADKHRVTAIEKANAKHGREVSAAKLEFRNSPGWQGERL